MNNSASERVPFLDLRAQHRGLSSQLRDVFEASLTSASFIGGAAVDQFEADFSRIAGAPYVVGVSSGTDAIVLALRALGVGHGEEVVTVPNTFAATAEAITKVGAIPTFVDVLPTTALMDPQRLEDLLRSGKRPAAVIPVHLYGQCADMVSIVSLARTYGFYVVEDAAQAHGASQNGRLAGSLGDAAAFSFYPGKNLGALGDAGAVATSDPQVADTIRRLRDHGQSSKHIHVLDGYTARLDAMQAGFLSVKLQRLADWNEKRRGIAAAYDAAFREMAEISPVRIAPGNLSSRHLYVVRSPDRNGLRSKLDDVGVETALHYPTPIHLQPCRIDLGLKRGDFPVSERICSEVVSLPIYPEMTDVQVAHVIDGVRTAAR